MANILILGVRVPFTSGGQDVLVKTLAQAIKERGHKVDFVELPFAVFPKESMLNQAAVWRSLDLSQFGGEKVDLVIATKFPSYYSSHPVKSLWLVHQHRPLYDLYAGRYSDISDDPRDEAFRQMLVDADKKVIAECAYISGISRNVIDRLENFNGIKGEVLYPPLSQGDAYYNKEAEPYILSVGRICSIKRVDLMLKAMPIVHQHVKLKIVGRADETGVMDYLNNEIDKHHLWDRIEFVGGISDQELLDLYAKCLAVYYAPHNEDYGYVTLEAMASGKPVITAHDSGGVLEFIVHERNGLITNPDVDSIGHSVNRLVEDAEFATSLGKQGRLDVEATGLLGGSWDKIVDGLLSPLMKNSKVEAA